MIEKVIENHHHQLYRIAYSYMRNNEDAEDMLQSAYEKALKSEKQLKDRKKAKSWLVKIIINECNQMFRMRKKQKIFLENLGLSEPTVVDVDYSQNIQIKDALLLLDEEQRNLVVLKHLMGYRQREISAILDMPIGTVKSKLSRSMEILREIIGGDSCD